jgi:hypothetical protein
MLPGNHCKGGKLTWLVRKLTVELFFGFSVMPEIVLGELVDVLCGFSNNGDKSFNITQMRGSLHNAIDYKTIMNLTEANPFAEIKKGEHGTMNYRFFLDPALDPAKYALTLSIDYIDADREEYRTVYFNSTVDLVESASDASSRAFFGRFITIGVLGLVAFLGNNAYKKYSSKKGRRTVDSAAKAASGDDPHPSSSPPPPHPTLPSSSLLFPSHDPHLIAMRGIVQGHHHLLNILAAPAIYHKQSILPISS